LKKHTLFKKILLAMLTLSLIPLLCSSSILFINLTRTGEKLAERISDSADLQASENLEMRARQIAENISHYLKECEADLLLVASLRHEPEPLRALYASRRGEIWYRTGSATAPAENRVWVPRYASLEIIDNKGTQRFAIKDGHVVLPELLVNVANPANTEYRCEDYFSRAARLKNGEIYVSHVTGFHISKEEQLGGATDPEHVIAGKQFRGVVRFATPLYSNGKFDGVAVLSLDHRHLMEFSQHILPGKERTTVFPSYKSGNYAFIFDDEGWIITHPKFWDIRGVDGAGRLVPPYTASSSAADVRLGRIPFNLDHAGFVHANYPFVSREIRQKRSGHVDITNVGGAKKMMVFAPILYDTGGYRRSGVFGGVTIGFQTDQFHETARTGVSLMSSQLQSHLRLSALIIALTSLLVALSAWLLSRGITRPLAVLTEGARKVANGETEQMVAVSSRDEIGQLATDFNRMAEELEGRKARLMKTLQELRTSRREIMAERNFKANVLESIFSGILTISPDGLLTSINSTGQHLLGKSAVLNAHYGQFLRGWGDVPERITTALKEGSGYGRMPHVMETGGAARFFDVGVFPIGKDGQIGLTVTIRDETEQAKLREEMVRMDRFASLGKLSAGIAHEIRNPLTGISLLLDDLHDRASHDPESQAMMRKALAEIERVEGLIAALLNFASPAKARFREGDLNLVAQDTLLLLRRECEKHGVALQFSPGKLPPFKFDIEKIKQVLLNLVKNALEALPQPGEIRVATAGDKGMASLTVSDNGSGIAAEDLSLIFEPFFTRKGAGTGLGLSIIQRIVEEHHGTIAVASSAGEGTTFTIILPMNTE
jgi:signal transduction histidine kinase